MSAIDKARAALRLPPANDKYEQIVVVLCQALRDLIAEHERLTAPPTDDERETLDLILRANDGYWPQARDEILAKFRRRGPITDEMIDAAYAEFWRIFPTSETRGRDAMRAALEAAEALR